MLWANVEKREEGGGRGGDRELVSSVDTEFNYKTQKKKDANTQKRRERENRRLLQSSAARNTEHDSRGEKKEKSF
jgi:hypothetical protein